MSALAMLCKLWPVTRDWLIEIERAPIREHVGSDRDNPLRYREYRLESAQSIGILTV
jgi:hypothetical protein